MPRGKGQNNRKGQGGRRQGPKNGTGPNPNCPKKK